MNWLHLFIAAYPLIVYPAIVIGTVAEMMVTLLLFGALAQEGYVNFGVVFLLGFLGSVAHDILFWYIGRHLGAIKKTRYLFFDFSKVDRVLERLRPVTGIAVFFSKFIWNVNRIVLVSAGYVRTELWRLVRASIPASLVWALVLTSIGYVFADQTALFRQRIEYAGLMAAGVLALVVVVQLYARKFVRRHFLNGNISQPTKDTQNL